ncbi:family 20 glycosylhydrolase [Candidatus Hydrogenedentota bacterium]
MLATLMKFRISMSHIAVISAIFFLAGCSSVTRDKRPEPWRAVSFMYPQKEGLPYLKRAITETLAPAGVNTIILVIEYWYEFDSHPELREQGAMSFDEARELADLCRKNGIRLIPHFNCLGHQSGGKHTRPLLVKYPEFDETPEIPSDNSTIYARSWCPLHPELNKLVFDLFDDLIDAFQAEYFHVGMDEVFLIGNKKCSRCKGKDRAELYAKAVNDYHEYLVGKKGLTMMMWGDRLVNSDAMGYGMYEGSQNHTEAAIDLIPKDIIICDWHYGMMVEYPSIPLFLEKGFRVLPASFDDTRAAIGLRYYASRYKSKRMLGHLCTTWDPAPNPVKALLKDKASRDLGAEALRGAEAFRAVMKVMDSADGED